MITSIKRLISCVSLVSAIPFCPIFAENIVFPPNCGVVDITKPPYNADNTGKTDVSAILTQALTDERALTSWISKIVYLPNGTYLVRSTIRQKEPPFTVGPHLQGQSKAGTVIRLADSTWPVSSGTLQFVLSTGNGVAQCFNRGVRNLTVSIGRNNAGASGIWWFGNNEALLSDVDVISEDGTGMVGLNGGSGESGPSGVRNLYVKGFSVGVQVGALNAVTFQNVTVEGQRTCGILNSGQPAWFDNFVSINRVRAVRNTSGGSMVLVDANLTGGDSTVDAISNEGGGKIFVRNVTALGYRKAISCASTTQPAASIPAGMTIDEFSSHGSTSLFPSEPRTINLPRKSAPEPEWEQDMSKWAIISSYTTGRTHAQAFQAAIDDLTKTVVALDMDLNLSGTVYVRNNIKFIIGTKSCLFKQGTDASIEIVDGISPVVKFQNINYSRPDRQEVGIPIVQRSSRALIVESSATDVHADSSGDVFVTDLVAKLNINNPLQHVWAWHFNGELYSIGMELTMTAGVARIFGWKSEHENTKVATTGGTLEILGFLMYSPSGSHPQPLFQITNTNFCCALLSQIGNPYNLIVRETRAGVTKDLTGTTSGTGTSVPLFLAYNISDAAKNPRQGSLPAPQGNLHRMVRLTRSPLSLESMPASAGLIDLMDTRGRVMSIGRPDEKGRCIVLPVNLPLGVYYMHSRPCLTVDR
jgi:hypothetical protein